MFKVCMFVYRPLNFQTTTHSTNSFLSAAYKDEYCYYLASITNPDNLQNIFILTCNCVDRVWWESDGEIICYIEQNCKHKCNTEINWSS